MTIGQDEIPGGVELYDLDDHKGSGARLFEGVKKQLIGTFPQSYGGVTMSVKDVEYVDPEEYSLQQQKDAILKDKFLSRRLKGTLELHDEKTGDLLDSRNMTLMRVPYLTPERGTFLHGGNEYASLMQARLIPGAYTRRQKNGGLETQFNVKSGTGSAFRIGFEPDTSQYRMRIQQANLHLYSLLHDLGIPDEHLEKTWGKDILQTNRDKYDARVFDKAYERIVLKKDRDPNATAEDKIRAIKSALEASKVSRSVLERTLPNALDMRKSASWVQAIAREALEEQFVKNSSSFCPDYTPDELTEERNARHGVGPRLAGMAEWPAEWLPEYDASWFDWWEQYSNGRRTDDDARQIMRWKRFKRLHGDRLREKPTPRRAFALKAWGIDPLKLVDGRQRSRLKKDMEAYRDQAREEHEKSAIFQDEDWYKVAAVLLRDFKAGIDLGAKDICQEVCDYLQARPDINAEAIYARLGDHEKAAEFHAPLGLWVMEKFARYGAGVLFKQPNGKYLLQENRKEDVDDPAMIGKLRPAGGGKSKKDRNLRDTILREMEEEFDLDPDDTDDKVELLGYIDEDGPFKDCAVFCMKDHGLEPGVYQASNSKNEKVKLVEASLSDKRYIGPQPKDLRPFADEKHPGNKRASEGTFRCPHCGETFDLDDLEEIDEDTQACPNCNKFISDDDLPKADKPQGVVMRFTRFEIRKIATQIEAPVILKSATEKSPKWDYSQGIFTDTDYDTLKKFSDKISGMPSPWDPSFDSSDFLDSYVRLGGEALKTKPYGTDLIPWIANAKKAYGFVRPGARFTWSDKESLPAHSLLEGIDFTDPVARSFANFNDDGSLKSVNDDALHYLAFRTSPAAGYRQLWNEFAGDKAEHMAELVNKYTSVDKNFHPWIFDKYVRFSDPDFYETKTKMDKFIAQKMRPTAQIYADFARKGMEWDQTSEDPMKLTPGRISILKKIGVGGVLGASALGGAALGYWLWRRKRKKEKEHNKDASAKQLKSYEDARQQVLRDLLQAKAHSDRKEYGQKHYILSRLFRDYPAEFILDDDMEYAGVSHLPTGFKIHAPRNLVPVSIANSELTKKWMSLKRNPELERMRLDSSVLQDIIDDK